MSLTNKAIATCSSCNHKTEITVYKSINVSEEPELKGKVKDGSLFLWTCPECGQVNLAKYDVLYHDPVQKMMIWLYSEGDLSKAQQLASESMADYTLRLVGDTGSLMEKVLIKDAGLDDIAIEMCKFVTKMEMTAKDSSLADILFKFFRAEADAITLMYPDKGKMQGVRIGINVYEDCLGIIQRNPSLKEGKGFLKIDSAWLESFMA